MTSPAQQRFEGLERFAAVTSKWTLISAVICNLVPTLLLSVIALIQGATTGQFPEGGGLGASADFPPFDPQLWMAWIPVVLYAAWTIATIPLPLTGQRFGRGFMLLVGAIVLFTSIARVAGFFSSERVISWGSQYTIAAVVVIMGVLLLRILLGWFRLVPRSWRRRPGLPTQRAQ